MAFFSHWNGCVQYLLATFEASVSYAPSLTQPGVNRTVLTFEESSWVQRMIDDEVMDETNGWSWAFFIAVNRSRVDAIGVGGLYFGAGSTPRVVRWHLLGATTMQLVAGIVTASIRPFTPLAFGTLVWIFGIGMMGLWTARYGEFEPTDEPVDNGDDTEPDTPDSLDEGDGADEA